MMNVIFIFYIYVFIFDKYTFVFQIVWLCSYLVKDVNVSAEMRDAY